MNRHSLSGLFLGTLLAAGNAGAITQSDTLALTDDATVVALDGDILVVGAPYAVVDGAQQVGRAFVYLRTGTAWAEQTELVLNPDDLAAFDEFGTAVAISGDTVVIGARRQDSDRGAAYVFVRSGPTWTQQAKLTTNSAAGDGFGAAVAITGDTAVIGASGANTSYVFKRTGATWTQQPTPLTANDGLAGDGFGCAVAAAGDSALIGAPGQASRAGAAYLFKSAGGDWSSPTQTKLTTSGGANAGLGYAVDLSGRVALLGAPGKTSNTGAAYVFYSNGTTWSQQASLTITGGAAGDRLGQTVNLGGEEADIALLGAPGVATAKGAAYLFTRQGAAWTPSTSNPLTASAGKGNDALGRSVALFGDTAVAMAPGATDAYVYRFDCGFGRYWPPGVWLFPGLQCKPDVETVHGQFSDDLGGDAKYGYSNRWYMYDWIELSQSFLGLTVNSTVTQGGGYQLKTLDGGRVNFSGSTTTPLVTCHYAAGCFEIPLTPPASGATASSVNLIGHPFPYPVDWADVRFVFNNNGVLLTPSAAQAANLANKSFRRYNGNANETWDDSTPGMNGNLFPNESVWVWVKTGAIGGTIKLLIPAKPSRQNTATWTEGPNRFARLERLLAWLIPAAEAAPPDDTKAAARDARRKQHRDSIARGEEWYVRLIVETADGRFADPANVLGQLADAANGYDDYDLDELPPLADGPALNLVFPHPEWKKAAGDYSSDYHPLNKNKQDRWTFQVRGNQTGTLRLRWEATSPEALARGRLVDEETGAVIAAADVDHYEFALTGPARTFRWDYVANNGKPPK